MPLTGITKTLIREPPPANFSELSKNIVPVTAVLARIHYRHDRGVERYLYLRAHVFFYDLHKKLQKQIIDGIWDDDELKASKHIHVGSGTGTHSGSRSGNASS